MSQKQRVRLALVAFSFLFLCATLLWADSEPAGVKCLPEQPSDDVSLKGDDLSFKAGVRRNQVLLEIVTGTWCPYCPYAAVAADSLETLKGDSLAVLEYHWADPFSNSDADGRRIYYGIDAAPWAKIDGRRQCIGGGSGTFGCYLNAYNQEMITPGTNISPCTLRVDVLYDSTSRYLKVKTWVTKVDTFSNANAHLRYAIAESHKYYQWQWLDSLHHIVRKMLPNYNGVAFDINQWETFADSQSYTLDPTWVARNCYVVVFVQADDYLGHPVFRCAKVPLFPTYVFGDCNGDGVVDVADAVFITNYLFKGGPCPNPYGRGDVNRDCMIDVGDLVYLINYLFKGGNPPLKGCD